MEINFADRKMEKMEVEKTEKSAGCIAVEESKVKLGKFWNYNQIIAVQGRVGRFFK